VHLKAFWPTIADSRFKVTLALVALIAVAAQFFWQGRAGFDFGDEGFLWYGAQRILVGDVPIRDFMSYDPGRYYFSSVLMLMTGDNGIMSLRFGSAVFQMAGLFVGLSLIARSQPGGGNENLAFLFASALVLLVWMFPRHKLFDISLSLFLVGILTYWLAAPRPGRYFIAGFCIGLIAVFGRNHGVYGVAASLSAMIWLVLGPSAQTRAELARGMLLWTAGVAAGFFPILLMLLLIPDFASAFFESIQFLFQQKATNLPLPIPWPWNVDFASASLFDSARGVLIGAFFVGLILFGVLGMSWVFYARLKGRPVAPALAASIFLTLPYAHFAFSRADVNHLAQGIFPMLVGLLVLLAGHGRQFRWPLAGTLFGASFWVMLVVHPGWQCRVKDKCVDIDVSGSKLQVVAPA